MTSVRGVVRDLFDPPTRVKLAWLAVGSGLAAMLEALSFGLVVPALASFTSSYAGALSPTRLMWGTAAIVVVFMVKAAWLVWLYGAQCRVLATCQTALALRLFRDYVRRDYAFHLRRDSSELIRNVTESTASVINGVVGPAMLIIAEAMVIATLVATMVMVNARAALSAFVLVAVTSVALHRRLQGRLRQIGKAQHLYGATITKAILQGLGAVKEAKVLGRGEFFVKRFHDATGGYASAAAEYRSISERPRHVLELIAVIALSVVAWIVVRYDERSALPYLGLFAVCGARLAPSANRIQHALNSIRLRSLPLEDLLRDLRSAPPPESKSRAPMAFSREIVVEDLSLRYDEAAVVALHEVSLTIGKGETVAIVGASGAGKSTLVDVMLGLLHPSSGSVRVDGVDIHQSPDTWQGILGYVPQAAYLTDDSIRRNVGFGLPDDRIDDARIWTALERAQLATFVRELPAGLDTRVGEMGVRISGGQRQRLGIARALYHEPEVLFLDEPTSALDPETERDLLRALGTLRGITTTIVVAHRLSTVRHCDRLLFLSGGRLVASGTFDAIVRDNAEFRSLVQVAEGTL